MKVGVIIPMENEYLQVQQLIGGNHGRLGRNEVVLRRSGIGKVNAALGTQQLILEEHPDCIINTGVAGGIDVRLRVMDMVVASECVYHDVWCGEPNMKGQVQGLPERFACAKELVDKARPYARYVGLLCTGDQFITNDERLHQIKADFPEGLAVDMESCAIAHTCHLHQVPFLALRIISDIPAEAKTFSDHQVQYNNFWQSLADRSFTTIRQILTVLSMDKIPSFTIDHNHLLRGIYVSRKDQVGNDVVTTFDIRMKEPNRDIAIGQGAIHTIEHLAATYLRNDPEWSDRIIYWGPMGCLTGNYLLVRGDFESRDILELMQRTFRFVAEFKGEVLGATPKDCGNYLLHDLPMARWESRRYLEEVLEHMKEENFSYPAQ